MLWFFRPRTKPPAPALEPSPVPTLGLVPAAPFTPTPPPFVPITASDRAVVDAWEAFRSGTTGPREWTEFINDLARQLSATETEIATLVPQLADLTRNLYRG